MRRATCGQLRPRRIPHSLSLSLFYPETIKGRFLIATFKGEEEGRHRRVSDEQKQRGKADPKSTKMRATFIAFLCIPMSPGGTTTTRMRFIGKKERSLYLN